MYRCSPAMAYFGPYIEYGADGQAFFANRLGTGSSPHRPVRRRRRKQLKRSWRGARLSAAIAKASRVAAARRWIPLNPLLAHLMQTEDAKKPLLRDAS